MSPRLHEKWDEFKYPNLSVFMRNWYIFLNKNLKEMFFMDMFNSQNEYEYPLVLFIPLSDI